MSGKVAHRFKCDGRLYPTLGRLPARCGKGARILADRDVSASSRDRIRCRPILLCLRFFDLPYIVWPGSTSLACGSGVPTHPWPISISTASPSGSSNVCTPGHGSAVIIP